MMGNFIKTLEKDADFDGEVLQSSVPVLAYFSASWNGPCQALRPIVDGIDQDLPRKVKVVEINIDECIETTRKYGIKSVPTILAFHRGEKVGSAVGLTTRENLLKLVGL